MKTGFVNRSLARLAAFFGLAPSVDPSTPARQRIVRGSIGGRDGFAFDWRRAHLRALKFARRRG